MKNLKALNKLMNNSMPFRPSLLDTADALTFVSFLPFRRLPLPCQLYVSLAKRDNRIIVLP